MSAIVSKRPRSTLPPVVVPPLSLSLFESAIGWFGLLGGEYGISRLVFAHASPPDVRAALDVDAGEVVDRDWSPQLRKKFENYALGKPVRFEGVVVARARSLTAFQQRVVEIVQAIPRGETLTYGQVATLAGSPGAARAVGTVMSSNPVPIIVPCHRVVGSAGGLGGFSAAGGVRTKQWMLEIESRH